MKKEEPTIRKRFIRIKEMSYSYKIWKDKANIKPYEKILNISKT
jgi:hypothetical protein